MILRVMGLVLGLFCFRNAIATEHSLSGVYLGSREGDPASLVENVSTIHGDYTEVDVDATVTAPDSLVLSRFYSSRDTAQTANFGGWRFNPHSFLSVQKDPKGKIYATSDGMFERAYVYVGNPDGTILTYVGWQNTTDRSKREVFKIDPEAECLGLANSAKGNIGCWTNLKNNELYFDPQMDTFELLLCSEGKRFYANHPTLDIYCITHEILPSGNTIFYEFDEKGRLSFIKETNSSEKKVLAWIKIQYGNDIHVETSDGKTIEYHFQEDSSGSSLLTEVIRSDKPDVQYQYQVVDNHALLLRKTLPEGRFVEIDYYADEANKNRANKNRVRSVTAPADSTGTARVQFSYGDNCTEVDDGPAGRKTVYRYDEDFQLVAIEQYLDGSLYRVHKKSWGMKSDASNLIATSVGDGGGNIFYCKYFVYDDKGNIIEEREYGDVVGIGPIPLVIDENGLVTNQDGHCTNYSYFSGKTTHGFFQTDAKGTGVKYWYKKGTNLLIKKFLLTKGSPDREDGDSGIKKRYFYEYNEDAALTKVIVDDGGEKGYWCGEEYIPVPLEGHITLITPKQELPHVGAPEIIEEKYFELEKDHVIQYMESKSKREALSKRTVNQFDAQGNIVSQAVYDANQKLAFTITKGYVNGLLAFETDPLGNETRYSYDRNRNLISETSSNTAVSIEYVYDLRNRLICTIEKDRAGKRFETHASYDAAGNTLFEIDRYGNKTLYTNDDLGRPIQITYPEVSSGRHSSIKPIYTYTYDLFDNPISVTDPKGRTLARAYNVQGKPTEIHHLDGTKEVLRYDSGGNLDRYEGRDGVTQLFSYDYIGRLNQIKYLDGSGSSFKKKTYGYNPFHKISETDENGRKTTYTYTGVGRLASICKNDQKVEFVHDSLGRTRGVKRWKTSNTYTLEVREYDLLDRVIEERTEDTHGKVLIKKKYVYNDGGQLAQVIGYPQNKESILLRYEYDGFGRLIKATNAVGHETTIMYDDAYIDEWGQKTRKRTLIDPLGTQTEEVFDADDHVLKVSKKDASGQLLAGSESSYDSSGNKILERVLVLSPGESSKTYETERSFNQRDQLESCTFGKGMPEERTVRFEYNAHGDIAAKYNHGSKGSITYRYNDEGKLDTVSYKEGEDENRYGLYCDRRKNINIILQSIFFKVFYSFNPHDIPLSETIEDGFGSYRVGRTHDGEGKIQTLQLPDGSFIEYRYEGPFVKGARRLSKEKKELYTYQVTSRDQMGHILEEILPGRLGGRKQLWDAAGRRVEISTDFFQDRVLEGGYDPLENIKKRETTLDKKKQTTNYEYNALAQLIAEKGKGEHMYSYDSIGNCLQRDGSPYKVNGANQLVEAHGAVYTFGLNGSLATKTAGKKTWTYQSNLLNQIVSIKDPDHNNVEFTYDPSGKRLTKQIKAKGTKTRIFRFFYLGDTEIGSVDENGVVTELKIPSDPNNPEAPCIAIEVGKETYVPLYDLQGNIVCLLDHQRRKIRETYRYSVYGKEEIINEGGKAISGSSVGNPWRYRGKRIDTEIGLIYFGYRYYDPEVGRWITPDPAGAIDGPNLYAYARSNPMTYVDYFGLSSALDDCRCTQHDHPGWENAPAGCVCICDAGGIASGGYRSKAGSNIASAMSGIGHGVVDFVVRSLHDLQTAAVYMGSAELEMSLHERTQMIEVVEQSQANQMGTVEAWMMDLFSIDGSDSVYQSFRSKTTLGLEVGSLVAGGYGAVKGVIAFNRLAKAPIQAAELARRLSSVERKGVSLAGSRRAPLEYAPFQTIRNEATVINNRTYIGHALDRMQDRGFMPSVIENAIETGKVTPTKIPGRFEYYDPVNNLRVILQDKEIVISVIPTRSGK